MIFYIAWFYSIFVEFEAKGFRCLRTATGLHPDRPRVADPWNPSPAEELFLCTDTSVSEFPIKNAQLNQLRIVRCFSVLVYHNIRLLSTLAVSGNKLKNCLLNLLKKYVIL